MGFVLSLLIVAVQGAAPTDAGQADAVKVFHNGFEEEADRDYDGWPDGWTRKQSHEFPAYLPIKIVPDSECEGTHALRIDLNGGGAVLFGPPIKIGPLFSYVFEGSLRTEGLKHDRAYYSVTFYDAQGHALETFESEKHQDLPRWKKLRLGPLTPSSEKIDTAVVALHLEPQGKADLKGTAWFDDVSLARLPRMTLQLNSPHHVFASTADIEVTCQVAGVFVRAPSMKLEIVDISNGRSDKSSEQVIVAEKSAPATALLGQDVTRLSGFAGATTWKPKIKDPGLYLLRARLEGDSGTILQREETLAVIEPQRNGQHGEFGWTLPHLDRNLSLTALGQLLPQMGINWAKYPVWVSEKPAGRLDQLVSFADRLSSQGVESIGLLGDPPPDIRLQLNDMPALLASDIFFADPKLWYPLIEPVITQLSLQIRWWQLGQDSDTGFISYADLAQRILDVKKRLQRFGQEVHLGIPWRPQNEVAADEQLPWEFLMLSSTPSLTADELGNYLPPLERKNGRTFVSVDPLPRDEYRYETRAADLVQRMIAAKVSGAQGIFVSDPFDPQRGLLDENGTPGELLLVWRTTAIALAGAEPLGSMVLPGASKNYVFQRDGKVLMVVWNERPTREKINLGDQVTLRDVWGRVRTAAKTDNELIVEAGPLPIFITGIQPALMRWILAFNFQHTQLPTVFGTTQTNAWTSKNEFGQSISGQARLSLPEGWKAAPRQVDFKLGSGEQVQQPFGLTLPFDASSGRELVRVDFDIDADKHYQFSVYRFLEIGKGDISLDAIAHLNSRGELEIEQYFVNHGDDVVSFKCSLFAPNRRRMVSQVVRLGTERDVKTYRLPDGKELIGQALLIRAEEVEGTRVLNYRFIVEP